MKNCLGLASIITPSEYPDLIKIFSHHNIKFQANPLGKQPTEDELIPLLKNIDAVLAGGEPYNLRILDSAPNLKIIARVGVGYDNVDLKSATKKHIAVTLTPILELSMSVAEETIALILSLLKKIPFRDSKMRKGCYDDTTQTVNMFSLNLGILGLGRIGSEVAKRAKTFGTKLLYYDFIRKPKLEREIGIDYVSFDNLLKKADILCIHVPLTSKTHKFIGVKEFKQMKNTAYIINTARGVIIDEEALLWAIRKGRIAGAALGVYSQEPPTEKHPFYKIQDQFPNLILLPHMAVGTTTKKAMIHTAAKDVISVLTGKKPKYPLNIIQ